MNITFAWAYKVWSNKPSPVSFLQYSCPWRCQETQMQRWTVRTFIRTFLIVSWSWERAWTTIRRTWPARGEWRPCAGDNNLISKPVCEQHAASICAYGTSPMESVCFFFFKPFNQRMRELTNQLWWVGIKIFSKNRWSTALYRKLYISLICMK